MNEFSMPGYFQNMPTLPAGNVRENPDNAKELLDIEEQIHAQAEKMLAAGVPDEKLHSRGQMTAMERILALVDEDSFCPLNSLYNPQDNKAERIGIVSTGVVKGLGRIDGK